MMTAKKMTTSMIPDEIAASLLLLRVILRTLAEAGWDRPVCDLREGEIGLGKFEGPGW
jgi:hypothetical protein